MDTNILKRALVSEKSFSKVAEGKFTFVVAKTANKKAIAESIEELFGVNVLSINMLNIMGKVKRSKKGLGKRSNYKKAIVQLKKGQKIDLFEIEKPEEKEKGKKKAEKSEETVSSDTTVKVREKKK